MSNTFLCKECFLETHPEYKAQAIYWFKGKPIKLDESMFEHSVRLGRLPAWDFTQSGRKPVCGRCGKEGTVYG